jgi:plastocyanin
VGVGATAAASAGGSPLASVEIDVSWDNGNSWGVVADDVHPSSPSDTESATYAFPQAGAALLRAVATDSGGRTAASTQAVAVGRAIQGPVAVYPASVSITAGQSVAFSASGGSTGSYSWGGSASGSGPAQTVTFPASGSYAVTVFDTGNANFSPSPPASSAVTVQNPFYTLSLAASGAGSVSGGGSYPPNSQATATAVPGPGSGFAGWTGDVTASTPSLSILMSANKSVMAHFTALLPQSISYTPPGAVSTRSPAFALAATSSSGLPVSLALGSGPAKLEGNVVTPSGATGQVTITATQPGNAQYLPAQPVVITFAIGPPPPGVILSDDSAATKRSDKDTRATSFTSDGTH